MKTADDLWDEIGEIPEDELVQVLTKLFIAYQEMYDRNPDSPEAKRFFTHLDNAITLTRECNLNRR